VREPAAGEDSGKPTKIRYFGRSCPHHTVTHLGKPRGTIERGIGFDRASDFTSERRFDSRGWHSYSFWISAKYTGLATGSHRKLAERPNRKEFHARL
jgi:hypothetical protein